MKTTNTLDKSFGPIGSTAGYFLIIAGIIAAYTSLYGLILVALGALLGFTSTCTIIDFDKKRIKFSEILFGIIPTGKWIPIIPGMTIGIKESKIIWTGYSRSNRSLDIDNKDFRLILFDTENNEVMPIKKTDSLDSAIAELETLCNKLELLTME